MSVLSDIKSTLSHVGVVFTDGLIIEYRSLTSAPNANPRTYSSIWTAIVGARTYDYSEQQMRNEDQGVWYKQYDCTLSIPDEVSVPLDMGSQIRIGGVGGQTWAVQGVEKSAAGSVHKYRIGYAVPMYQDPRLGGGV